MPTYSFECRKCGKRFLEILSFREYEEGKRKCPKCGSRDVVQLLEGFYAKTSKKSEAGGSVEEFAGVEAWRVFRIMSEFVDGFESLRNVGPAISVFGSARTQRNDWA